MSHDLDAMCLTWRHDFGLLPADEQDAVRAELRQLWEHHVRPLHDEVVRLERDGDLGLTSALRLLHDRDNARDMVRVLRRRAEQAEAERDRLALALAADRGLTHDDAGEPYPWTVAGWVRRGAWWVLPSRAHVVTLDSMERVHAHLGLPPLVPS